MRAVTIARAWLTISMAISARTIASLEVSCSALIYSFHFLQDSQ
jgi:hypothetical protein